MDSFFQVVAHAGGRTNEEAAAQERIDCVDVNVSTDMPCPDFPMTAADSGILLFFSRNASIAPLVDSQTAPPRNAYDDTDRLASVDRPEDTNMRSSSGGGWADRPQSEDSRSVDLSCSHMEHDKRFVFI